MRHRSRLLATTSAFAVLALTAGACGSQAGGGGQASGGKIAVAASTNVWGSVAAAIGADKVEVKPVIKDPSGDPHSYQSTPQDAADVQQAQLTLGNGGGYDDFFGKLTDQAPNARKLVAFDISGKGGQQPAPAEHDHEQGAEHHHDHGGPNEHVWYDLETVGKVVDQLAVQLGELQPEAKQTFTDNAAAFKGKLGELTGKLGQIGAAHPDRKVLATEPVAHYMLDTAKVTDATPHDFAEAIENETDVPPAALDEATKLIGDKQVQAVVQNVQTSTPVTNQVVGQAKNAGVPVVEVTETLPAGVNDYLTWIGQEVDALAGALNRN